ncbi:MAG: hypothetical protein PHG66_06085 [Candidatus Colwellbacteria bacterium]|nr:hypothetical protein [Candidatus Colwellbacteria bacterium]
MSSQIPCYSFFSVRGCLSKECNRSHNREDYMMAEGLKNCPTCSMMCKSTSRQCRACTTKWIEGKKSAATGSSSKYVPTPCKYGDLCHSKMCTRPHSGNRKKSCELDSRCTDPDCDKFHRSNICSRRQCVNYSSHNISCRLRHLVYINDEDKMQCVHNEGYGRCPFTCVLGDTKCKHHYYRGSLTTGNCKWCRNPTHHWVNAHISDGEKGHTMCRQCFLTNIGFVEWDKFYQSFVILMSANKDSCKESRKEIVEKRKIREEKERDELRKWFEQEQKRHQDEDAREQAEWEEMRREEREEEGYGHEWEPEDDRSDYEDYKRNQHHENSYDDKRPNDEAHYKAPEITTEMRDLIQKHINVFGFITIADVKTTTDVIKAFRKVSIKHHPDRGGNADLFKTLSSVRDYMIQILEGR